MGPLTEIHQCEVDAPMVFRLWMGNLKNVVATFVAHIIIIIIIIIILAYVVPILALCRPM